MSIITQTQKIEDTNIITILDIILMACVGVAEPSSRMSKHGGRTARVRKKQVTEITKQMSEDKKEGKTARNKH